MALTEEQEAALLALLTKDTAQIDAERQDTDKDDKQADLSAENEQLKATIKAIEERNNVLNRVIALSSNGVSGIQADAEKVEVEKLAKQFVDSL